MALLRPSAFEITTVTYLAFATPNHYCLLLSCRRVILQFLVILKRHTLSHHCQVLDITPNMPFIIFLTSKIVKYHTNEISIQT